MPTGDEKNTAYTHNTNTLMTFIWNIPVKDID